MRPPPVGVRVGEQTPVDERAPVEERAAGQVKDACCLAQRLWHR